jgi:hypothetical protein
MDAPVSIDAAKHLKQSSNLGLQEIPALLGRTRRAAQPVVKPRFRHTQPDAHLGDRRSICHRGGVGLGALRGDERILLAHRCSLAKYAAAEV